MDKVGKFTVKHKSLPFYFTWDGNENWEEARNHILSDLTNNGLSNFEAWENIKPKTNKSEGDLGYEKNKTKKDKKESGKSYGDGEMLREITGHYLES